MNGAIVFNTTSKWKKKNCQFLFLKKKKKNDYTNLHVGQTQHRTVSFSTALFLAIHLFVSSIK